jgi:hypothetical protein
LHQSCITTFAPPKTCISSSCSVQVKIVPMQA